MADHKVIFLEPLCHKNPENMDCRSWAENDPWGTCECGGNHKPTKYIRADLVDANLRAGRGEG